MGLKGYKHTKKREYKDNPLIYDPLTGVFTRKVGKKVGALTPKGYINISYKGKFRMAHCRAWEMTYGPIPEGMDIDHINGIRSDNRICNLRLATRSENNQNQVKPSKNNKLGILGVSFMKKLNKYRATIFLNYKQHHLGVFHTAEEARDAYIKAKRELHPFGTL